MSTMDCSYCHKALSQPKILCCSRLCKDCLQTHIEGTVKDDFIGCLVCSTRIKIPDPYRPREEWSGQYQTDLFLERMLAAAGQMAAEHNCFVCDSSRGAVTPSTQYCFNCDTYYCDGCNELHLQLRGLKGHSIVAIKDLNTKDIMTKRQLFCDKHKDKLLDVYCRSTNATKTPMATPGPSVDTTPQQTPSSSRLSQNKQYSPPPSGVVVCARCAEEQHKNCKTLTLSKASTEINQKLHKVRSKVTAVIDIQEQKSEALKERKSRILNQKESKTNEIETAFAKIQQAIDDRKEFLLKKVKSSTENNGRGIESMSDQTTSQLQAMKDIRTLLSWLEECGTEYDIATSGDTLINQYNHLYDLSRSPAQNDTSQYKTTIHIEESIITTFVQLVNMIGADSEGHIIAIKTKQISLRMPEDLDEPIIKDILLLEDGNLVVTDNKNKCVKMAGMSDAGDPRTVRLDLKTQPWGVTKLQVNVMAVTGHMCVYIITKTEDLHLQSTVRTKKDYWSVVALNSINLALTCKFPPSVDVIDITGRKLRTIETDGSGDPLFKVPQYVSTIFDKMLVSDRDGKTLTCLDQQGKHVFTFRGSSKQELEHPLGICSSKNGRMFMVESEDVWLLSSNGKMISKVISDVQGMRAVTEENGTLCVSIDGKGVIFYKVIDMSSV